MALITMAACLGLAPWVLSDYNLTLLGTGAAYSVAVLGISLGFASVGMLALTQPAMMLIGGFIALELVAVWHVPFLAATLVATAAGAVVAIPLGWLTCRLDRYAFSVLAFSFTYLVSMLLSSSLLVDVTGGELGKPFPPSTFLGHPLAGLASYGLVAVLILAAFASAAILLRSSLGRRLVVMNQDDIVARAVGLNADAHRIVITAIVSAFGAMSGALAGQVSGFIAPPRFDVALAVALLAMALVGGSRYLLGAFVGTLLLQVAPAMSSLEQVDRDLLVGVLLLLCLGIVPDGVLSVEKLWSARRRGRAGSRPESTR